MGFIVHYFGIGLRVKVNRCWVYNNNEDSKELFTGLKFDGVLFKANGI